VELTTQSICSLFHKVATNCLIDLYPASVVGLCLIIYKLEKLSDQRFQAKLSPSSSSGNSELKRPHAFQIPNCITPHASRIPVQETLPLSLEIPRCRPWYGMDIFCNHPLCF